MTYHLYCDGACNNSTNHRGGWAFILKKENKTELIGFGPSTGKTTNNRMELFAIYAGMKNAPEDVSIVVYSDSQYAISALSLWYKGWMNYGWKNALGEDVQNVELIKKIVQEQSKFKNVKFVFKKRNSTPEMNWADIQAKTGKNMVEYYIGPMPESLPIEPLKKKINKVKKKK